MWRRQWTLPVALCAVAGSLALLPKELRAQRLSACITFEDLENDRRYAVGESFVTGGLTIAVTGFTWANGELTNSGRAEVDDRQLSGGSGLDVNANNVNLAFNLAVPADGISLRFGEYGGNLNLEVNGDFRNFGNLAELNGQSVGGTTLLVSGGTGNDQGSVVFEGTINSFAIGGQELWIDDVCPPKDSAVTKSHEVSFYLGGLFTADTLPLNSGFSTGFRYAYYARPTFGLEIETGIAFTNELDARGLLGHAQLQLLVHPFAPPRPVDPFVLIGAGAVTYSTIGRTENSPLVVLGVGARFSWTEVVGFRLDARDLWFTKLFDESTHNFQVVWGPVFRF